MSIFTSTLRANHPHACSFASKPPHSAPHSPLFHSHYPILLVDSDFFCLMSLFSFTK